MIELKPALIPTGYRNGFEAYKLYSAISLHIQSDYDGVKYRWKKKIPAKHTPESFPDKYLFDKISRKYQQADWPLLFGRNCINTGWIREVLGDEGESRFLASRGFLENAQNKFESLFRSYLFSLHNNRIKFGDSLTGQTPFIMNQVQQKVYPIEFLILVDAITPFLATTNSIVYGGIAKRISKYGMMFHIDQKLLKDVVKSSCS